MYLGRQKCPSLKNNCFSPKAGRKGKDPKYDLVCSPQRGVPGYSPFPGLIVFDVVIGMQNTASMKCEKCDTLKYIFCISTIRNTWKARGKKERFTPKQREAISKYASLHGNWVVFYHCQMSL